LIIGFLTVSYGTDFLFFFIYNQDIFVEIYDHTTSEYVKNEYSLSEILFARAQIGKKELILTPELEERVIREIRNLPEENYSEYGIKNKSQLENLHIGKPIPIYTIENENLTFTGCWQVPVMFDGELLFHTRIKLEVDGQYSLEGYRSKTAEDIRNYEYKDLIIGSLLVRYGQCYLIIRRDNQDIFVQIYDNDTREYLKNEYSFSDVLNLLKK
jgi:hypothetical protein